MAQDKQKKQSMEAKTKSKKPNASTPAHDRRDGRIYYSSLSFATDAPPQPASAPPTGPATPSPLPDRDFVSTQPLPIQSSLYRGSVLRHARKLLGGQSGELSGPPLKKYLDDVGAFAKDKGLADSVVQGIVKEAKDIAVSGASKIAPQEGKKNAGSTVKDNAAARKPEPTKPDMKSSVGHDNESGTKAKKKTKEKGEEKAGSAVKDKAAAHKPEATKPGPKSSAVHDSESGKKVKKKTKQKGEGEVASAVKDKAAAHKPEFTKAGGKSSVGHDDESGKKATKKSKEKEEEKAKSATGDTTGGAKPAPTKPKPKPTKVAAQIPAGHNDKSDKSKKKGKKRRSGAEVDVIASVDKPNSATLPPASQGKGDVTEASANAPTSLQNQLKKRKRELSDDANVRNKHDHQKTPGNSKSSEPAQKRANDATSIQEGKKTKAKDTKTQFSKDLQSTSPPRKKAKRDSVDKSSFQKDLMPKKLQKEKSQKSKEQRKTKTEQKRAQEVLRKVEQQVQPKQADKLEESEPAERQTGKKKKNKETNKKPKATDEKNTPSALGRSPSVQLPPSREKQGNTSSGSQDPLSAKKGKTMRQLSPARTTIPIPLPEFSSSEDPKQYEGHARGDKQLSSSTSQTMASKRKRSFSVSDNGESRKPTTTKQHSLPTAAVTSLFPKTPVGVSKRQLQRSKAEQWQQLAVKRLSDAGHGSSGAPSPSLAKSRSGSINEGVNIVDRRRKSKSLESALSKETKGESSGQETDAKKPSKKKRKLEEKARKQEQRDDFAGPLSHQTPKPVKDWQPLESESTPVQPEPVEDPVLDAGVKAKGYQALELDATPPQSDLEDDSASDAEISEQNREASPESEAEESEQASDSESNADTEQEGTGKGEGTTGASQTITLTPRKMGAMAGITDMLEYTTSLIRGLAPPPLSEPVVQKKPVAEAQDDSESEESESSDSSEQSDDSEKSQQSKRGPRSQPISKPQQVNPVPPLLGHHAVQKPNGLVTEANEDSDSDHSESYEDSEPPPQSEKPQPSKPKSPVLSEKQMNQSAHALPLLGQHVVQKSNDPGVTAQDESESEQSEESEPSEKDLEQHVRAPSLLGRHTVQQPVEPHAAAQDESVSEQSEQSEAESSVTSKEKPKRSASVVSEPQSPSKSESASDPAGAEVAHEQDANSDSDIDVQRDEHTPVLSGPVEAEAEAADLPPVFSGESVQKSVEQQSEADVEMGSAHAASPAQSRKLSPLSLSVEAVAGALPFKVKMQVVKKVLKQSGGDIDSAVLKLTEKFGPASDPTEKKSSQHKLKGVKPGKPLRSNNEQEQESPLEYGPVAPSEKHQPEQTPLLRQPASEDPIEFSEPVESTEKSPDPTQIPLPESGSASDQHSMEQTPARTLAKRPDAKKARSQSTARASPHDIKNSARRGSKDSTGSQRVLRSMSYNQSPSDYAPVLTQPIVDDPETKVGRLVCVRIYAKPKASEDNETAIEPDQDDVDEDEDLPQKHDLSADEGSEHSEPQSEKKDEDERMSDAEGASDGEDQVTEDGGTDVDEKTPERPVFTISFSQNPGPAVADEDDADSNEDEAKSASSDLDDVGDGEIPAAAMATSSGDATRDAALNGQNSTAPQDVMSISSDKSSSEADSDEESNTRDQPVNSRSENKQPSAKASATQASPQPAKTPWSSNGRFMITTGSPIIETSKKMPRTRLSSDSFESAVLKSTSAQATPRSRRGTSEEFPWIQSSARSSTRKTRAAAAKNASQMDGAGSAPIPSTPPAAAVADEHEISEAGSRASSYDNDPKGFLRPDGSLSAQKRSTGLRSQHFTSPPGSQKIKRPPAGTVSSLPFPSIKASRFGLIQEELAHDPFQLLIAVIFLNKTKGTAAIPKFREFIARYPTPDDLVHANLLDITTLLRPLGMQNSRANTLIELAKRWLVDPPIAGRRHRSVNYPTKGAQRDIKANEILDDTDPRVAAFEIAHLPGCGPYALDSWRIFCRDAMRGVALDWNGAGVGDAGFEPEWKRVKPSDKELRAFLRWMWLREGWEWDPESGDRKLAEADEAKDVTERWRWDQEKGEGVWVDEEDVGEASENGAKKNAPEGQNGDVDMTDADADDDAPIAGLSSPHGKNGLVFITTAKSPPFRGNVEDGSSAIGVEAEEEEVANKSLSPRHEDDDSAALQLTQEAARASQQPLLDSPRAELRRLWPPPSSQPEPSSPPEQTQESRPLDTTQSSQMAVVDEDEEGAPTERFSSSSPLDGSDDELIATPGADGGGSPYRSLQGVAEMFKRAERGARWFFTGVVEETPQPESPAKKRAREVAAAATEAEAEAEAERGERVSSSPIAFRVDDDDDDDDEDMEDEEGEGAVAAARQASPEL